jgi:putative thioredoxin
MATTATTSAYVIDVTDQTFATEVLERSKVVPVVVDFWADWCGPCRMLGPILEKLAQEFQGKFILAKLDVDHNPNSARQYHVQGIPAVKAFIEGKVFNEFTGALPEPQVRKFLEGLIPSEADLLARQGYDWEIYGQPAMAEENYKGALAIEPDHYPAKIGLGRVLLSEGRIEEGISLLDSIPAGVQERPVADALIATAQFRRHSAGQNEASLRARLEAEPNDISARYRLANLLAAEQRFSEALPEFLEVIRRNRKYDDDGARKAMLAIFTLMGEDDPLTRKFRQQLANALF